jgi:hypothetical protein
MMSDFFNYKLGNVEGTEQAYIDMAWALPEGVAYWAAVRVMVHATGGKYSDQIVPDLKAFDALERWNNDKCPD